MGTRAGTVRRVVIEPTQRMFAEVELDDQARAFVRRDSDVVIRRRFGVAGAAFVDIARGSGAELDWSFAVLEAITERAPTDNISGLIDEARSRIFPILEDAGRAMRSLANTMAAIERGEGNVGRLLVDDTLVRQVEGTLAGARDAAGRIGGLVDDLQLAARDIRTLIASANSEDGGVPAVIRRAEEVLAGVQDAIRDVTGEGGGDSAIAGLLRRADQTMATLQSAIRDIQQAAARAPGIARNVEDGTRNLPTLLTQVQRTARELEQTLNQLRGSWLLGGSGGGPPPARLPAPAVRP
jgi:phospholipid/cholesterol/gamma-HCH transport system substrate-binding protein